MVVAHYEGSSVGSWSTYYKNGSATGITADAVYNYDYDSVGHMTSVIDNLQGRNAVSKCISPARNIYFIRRCNAFQQLGRYSTA